jgi:glutamate dehydrogenase
MLEIVRAYSVAKEVLGIEGIWNQLDPLTPDIDDARQRERYIGVQDVLEKTCLWLLNHHPGEQRIEQLIECYRPGTQALRSQLPQLLDADGRQRWQSTLEHHSEQGLDGELARELVNLHYLYRGLDVIRVAQQQQQSTDQAASAYFALDTLLLQPWLRQQISQLPESDLWQRKARAALANELDKLLSATTSRLLADTPADGQLAQRLEQWQTQNAIPLERCHKTLEEIRTTNAPNLAMLSVAVREMSALTL